MIRVKLKASLANPQSCWERNDEIEVPVPEARRLIYRGIAEALPSCPLPPATPAEEAAARTTAVRTVGAKFDKSGTLRKRGRSKGNWCEVEPIPGQ